MRLQDIGRKRSGKSGKSTKSGKRKKYIFGIDGEGVGRYPHLYTLLAYSDESGDRSDWVENRKGLSTKECFEFLLSLPQSDARCFAYSFQYDLTKMLKDVSNGVLYRLFRPDLRPNPHSEYFPAPEFWRDYELNMMGSKFWVKKDGRSFAIWDVWKFFGCKFTETLKVWGVGSEAELVAMRAMKDKRSEFDKQSPDDVRTYCLKECRFLSELVRKLIAAHDECDLHLTTFHGAGSTAKSILKKLDTEDEIRAAPDAMKEATACGFFGGRFENSVLGPVSGKIYGWDINSAYPYQAVMLPCLKHAEWELTTDERAMRSARAALVHYRLDRPKEERAWGPFPFRLDDGCITFPSHSGGGWVWQAEYIAGAELFPNVSMREAWVMRSDCTCRPPLARLTDYYRERCRIGSDGKGKVLKLGPNSVYGKLAQSVGGHQFQCWIWAGMITSGTRAQMLQAMALHRDLENLLCIATDGLYTREDLQGRMPRPLDTATFDCLSSKGTPKPLGGWDLEVLENGLFAARPGIYWGRDPTAEHLAKVRARGVGRVAVLSKWREIEQAYEDGKSFYQVKGLQRFRGAKSSITRAPKTGRLTRSDEYGEWEARPTKVGFAALPKRQRAEPCGSYKRLVLRHFRSDQESKPYDKATCSDSEDAIALQIVDLEVNEQPDGGDFCSG